MLLKKIVLDNLDTLDIVNIMKITIPCHTGKNFNKYISQKREKIESNIVQKYEVLETKGGLQKSTINMMLYNVNSKLIAQYSGLPLSQIMYIVKELHKSNSTIH